MNISMDKEMSVCDKFSTADKELAVHYRITACDMRPKMRAIKTYGDVTGLIKHHTTDYIDSVTE